MSKSDDIAALIPYYQQFIAERRTEVQKQAAKLTRRQAKAVDPSPDEADTVPIPMLSETATEPEPEVTADND